jgi:Fibronectin type III domain
MQTIVRQSVEIAQRPIEVRDPPSLEFIGVWGPVGEWMRWPEQLGRSRSRRRARWASLASALVVVIAVVVGGAAPAFAAPPDPPPQPGVTPLNGAILVSFVPPFDGGSAITSYTASCDSFDGGASGSNNGAASPIIVGGLTNGSSYQCTVSASNADGAGPTSPVSDATRPNTVPDAPAAPDVLPLNALILVSFVTPFDGGSAIIGYSVNCTSSDGGVAGTVSGLQSPLAVGSLSNGKTYTCTVVASNANGDSAPSAASLAAVPSTMPDAPAAPTVTSLNGDIDVSFVPPFDGGAPITQYTAACTSSDGGVDAAGMGAASPVVVSGVDLAKTYTCTLVASNLNGPSATSPPSDIVVPGATPSAPAKPTAVASNARVTVGFVPPFDGGATITDYRVQCTSTPPNAGVSRSADGIASPVVVAGLTNGKTYTCTVAAFNVNGFGPPSVASSAVLPKSVPGRPAVPAVAAANTRITVAFHAPANGGFPITKYRVACTSSNGGAARALITTKSPVALTGVTNGASYRCTVGAYSVVGAGPVSSPSAVAIPHSRGFRMFTGDGGVFTFGDAPYYGSAHSASLVIAMMTMPDNHGYWLVAQNGAVYPFGSARSYGSLAGHHLNRPIVGGTATSSGHGYWLVASDGGIFAFGDAHFFGSTGNIRLAQPIVGMTPTASGRGYWFVAADGGLFAFGDAHFFGSSAGRGARIVGMATSRTGRGYWIAANDGTVFGFGDARVTRVGPLGGLTYPIMGIARTDDGGGFWLAEANGGLFVQGNAPFIPWPGHIRLNRIIRGISR